MKEKKNDARFKFMLLALMVLQNSSVVIIGRYTRARTSPEDSFVVNNFVLVAEFCKFIASCVLESHTNDRSLLESVREHMFNQSMDFFRVSIPALLYLLQNSLLYLALGNLSAPMFQVIYQTKLLVTAIVSVILLDRKYVKRQWICLTTLGLGVAIVVLGKNGDKTENKNILESKEQNFTLGLICVSICCLSSAFAGVYFEKVLKKTTTKTNPTPSVWMRNMQLAFFSICIALVNISFSTQKKPFLHGFSFLVWVLVALQAFGGLLVANIVKYADNVVKGLATGVSVVFSTFCSIILFNTPMSGQFVFGASVILTSVYFFSNQFPTTKRIQSNPTFLSRSNSNKNLDVV